MDITMLHCITGLVGQQIVVDKRLGGLTREFHHHSRRRVGVHIRILTGDVIVLSLDYFEENITRLCLACYAALVSIRDIFLSHFLAGAFHKLKLHTVLNVLDCHLIATCHTYAVGDLLDKRFILAKLCVEHSLAYGGLDLFFIVANDTSVALKYSLYHFFGVLRGV